MLLLFRITKAAYYTRVHARGAFRQMLSFRIYKRRKVVGTTFQQGRQSVSDKEFIGTPSVPSHDRTFPK